ncbi:MAG TPA: hypothetical protein VJJ81_01805 [Candidatus Babeliales bacterium]|nr:hypothetical protein [Candidatus Babeliales bacterium]
MNTAKHKLLIINNFNLVILIFILNLIPILKSQAANPWMGDQTVIDSQTTMGVQGGASFNAQPITTASPATIPLAADDPGAANTPAAPTGFVADTAGASYISGIDAASVSSPAGTTSGATPTPNGTTGTAKPNTGPISTKVADLVKVAPADTVANLCAAASIIGEIPGCSPTADTSTKSATGPTPGTKTGPTNGAKAGPLKPGIPATTATITPKP